MAPTERYAAAEAGRTSFLGFVEHVQLEEVARHCNDALDETCWLVGSALQTRDHRDVDVRVIMDDDKFDALFGPEKGLNAFWHFFCVAVSVYMADRTGLNIDFQVQKRGRVKDEDWQKPRVPLGRYTDHETRRPAWKGEAD